MIDIERLAIECGPVRLKTISIVRVHIPLVEPFRISSGAVDVKDALLVRVSEGDAFGWGEASAMPGSFYSAETPESCQQELIDHLVPHLLGKEFDSIVGLNACLDQLSSNRFARTAIETACWELLARRQGVSLRELFRFPNRPIASGLAVGLYATEAELISAIHRYWADGYQRLKIKIKRGQDISLVQAVRHEFGDIPLFVDANADYSRDDFKVFQALDDYGLTMFEQPLAREDLDGAALLQKQVRTPICLDEGIETADDARRAIALGSCRIVNIKLQRVGGFLEALRISRVCEDKGIGLWVGTMPELGVGSAAALVLACHPGFTFPTDVEPSRRWYVDDVIAPEITVSGGWISLPKGPGLGYEVDSKKLARYGVRRWEFTA
ncbi:MAG: o-succinylbenzoate synthase [Acidobacteria bacterium]|nr:o-succinylbenzoate synthase [Acidobacteriota bacterium]